MNGDRGFQALFQTEKRWQDGAVSEPGRAARSETWQGWRPCSCGLSKLSRGKPPSNCWSVLSKTPPDSAGCRRLPQAAPRDEQALFLNRTSCGGNCLEKATWSPTGAPGASLAGSVARPCACGDSAAPGGGRECLEEKLSPMARKATKPDPAMQAGIDACRCHHLSHAHLQMARELRMNPERFGKINNHKQEPWKAPCRYSSKIFASSGSAGTVLAGSSVSAEGGVYAGGGKGTDRAGF